MGVERKLVREHKKRVLMQEFLFKETERAGFGGAEINRTPMGTRIHLVAERPGFVIGRRGSTIKKLTADLAEKFDLENPQIEVNESGNPNLNPQIMATKLAQALERGWHFRRAGHSTVRRIMESGAKGVQIVMSGKVTGGRSRVEKFTAGHIKHCGDTAEQYMRHGFATAKKKLGTIGVKVSIMDPRAVLPDEIDVIEDVPAEVEIPKDGGIDDGIPSAVPEPQPEGEAAVAAEGEVEAAAVADVEAEEAVEAEPQEPKDVLEAAAEAASEVSFEGEITDIGGVGKAKAAALEEAGYLDLADLHDATVDELSEVAGIGPKLAQKIKKELERLQE